MFTNSKRARQTIALAVATAGSAAILTGCSSDRNRLAEFRNNPTPDLVTMNERPDDAKNLNALIRNESKRMLYRDWRYAWYMDRPTRLTPAPSAW
ncbi:MAG: hypothetical protein Phyf2KO_27030 [Phycisphaerales bacterium]